MSAAINDIVSDLRLICQISKLFLSTISITILICSHVSGACQEFVLLHNTYIFMTTLLWFIFTSNSMACKYTYTKVTSNLIFLGIENVITLATFVCMASNTEDKKGLSGYEIVAISTGLLWGVHVNSITTAYIEHNMFSNQPFMPSYDEFDEEF